MKRDRPRKELKDGKHFVNAKKKEKKKLNKINNAKEAENENVKWKKKQAQEASKERPESAALSRGS